MFKLLSSLMKPEVYMICVLAVSAVSLLPPLLVPNNQVIMFGGFCLFELCVGIFWPSFSVMRSRYLPDASMPPPPRIPSPFLDLHSPCPAHSPLIFTFSAISTSIFLIEYLIIFEMRNAKCMKPVW